MAGAEKKKSYDGDGWFIQVTRTAARILHMTICDRAVQKDIPPRPDSAYTDRRVNSGSLRVERVRMGLEIGLGIRYTDVRVVMTILRLCPARRKVHPRGSKV